MAPVSLTADGIVTFNTMPMHIFVLCHEWVNVICFALNGWASTPLGRAILVDVMG